MNELLSEKVEQAATVLREQQIDAWLTFVRETTESGDPVLPMILGQPLTWQSALILTATGRRIAIVGKYEDEAVRQTGVWKEVIPYVEGIRTPLREILAEIDPRRLAINFSPHDVKADGLSHGMYLLLQEYLDGTPYGKRLVSAGTIINRLRGRKTAGEVTRIRHAIATTDEIFAAVASFARPGRTETDIAAFMHEQAATRGVETAWERAMCPIVTTGPGSMVGHGVPSPELAVRPGHVFHLDFGVRQDDYCSDLQRAWYVPSPADPEPPAAIHHAFEAIVAAINAAAAMLRPGVLGWEVDEAARTTLTAAGYPSYEHATGHHVGRAAHDGGGVLGPRWERYGRTPYYPVEAGNVLTLELGVDNVEGRGYLGLEEMLLVTDDGIEWLSTPQTELRQLGQVGERPAGVA
ncbi:MAG: aminopeptidase P family protein [Phycisphaerales bacterium]|nr:Xaa-Pro peptidase family protein [Phycisphaerae bacterium]NNF43919.1 aminopeptidase P family protein [Phycisphaerales bacterium]NNM25182.1 aminopeptidase P family protein [Phycisphaerales bacterium]